MASGYTFVLGLLSTSSITCDAVCAGMTPPGSTAWEVYGASDLYVDVNTSLCGFQEGPVYVTSLTGDTSHWRTTGSSEVYSPKATGFRIYLDTAITPAVANDRRYHMHWMADRLDSDFCSGRSSGWVHFDANTIYVDVDTSACGFADTPVIVTSLSGNTQHWTTTGSSEVYQPTNKSFRVYITYGGSLTPAFANDREWRVNWLADSLGSTRPAGGVCSGRTTPGSTNWVPYPSGSIYVDVNTSACGFQATPVYVTSLVGKANHRFTTGSSEVYFDAATGFRIYIFYKQGSVTPKLANSYGWHINWLATTVSTACTDTSGVTASSLYPCICGGSSCTEGELCLAFESRCQACPASYELTPAGCRCPLSHASAGGGPCLEVFHSAVARVADPSVSATKESNGYTYLLKLALGPLPSNFFEAWPVAYAIDVAPSREALDFQSNCTREWTVGPTEATIELTYGAFDGPCTLTASQGEGKFIRRGAVGIYIISGVSDSGKERAEWQWILDVALVFDATVIGMLTVDVNGERYLGNRTIDAGGFSSTLTLYQSADFTSVLPRPYALTVGDNLFVQQRLDQLSPGLSLELTEVYLASSQDAGDSSTIVRDVTNQVQIYVGSEGEARFTFVASRCESCVLHVISLVKFTNRRLRALSTNSEPQYALQSLSIGSIEEQESTITSTSTTPSTSVSLGTSTTSASQILLAPWLLQVATVLPAVFY